MLATDDIVPITRARAHLTELADDVVKTGRGKVLTRNGAAYVAIVTAADYDKMREIELHDQLHTLTMIADGLEDFEAGHVTTSEQFAPRLAAFRDRFAKSMPKTTIQPKTRAR